MQNLTANLSLNIDAISAIIERHGIDVKRSDDECIYINISSIPIFMRHDSERETSYGGLSLKRPH